MTATIERPAHIDADRWQRAPWHARQKLIDAWQRAQRPVDVTYENHREPDPPPTHPCPSCDRKLRSWQGVTSHHVRVHGGVLDVCEEGHDLTGPTSRRVGGGCRVCGNARDRARRAP